jgi:hypothetical protein
MLQAPNTFLAREQMEMYIPRTLRGFKAALAAIKSNSKYDEWPKTTINDLIDMVLDNAIHMCGLIPRDVYRYILGTNSQPIRSILFNDVMDKIMQVLQRRGSDVYASSDPLIHTIIALRMHPDSVTSLDTSKFDFFVKSAVMEAALNDVISKNDVEQVATIYRNLRSLPGGTVLAGHIFTVFALGRMQRDNPALPLKRMYYKSGLPAEPLFTANEAQAADIVPVGVHASTEHPPVNFMPTRGRVRQAWYEWNYKNGARNSLLEKGMVVFVPVATNHPLFDAFFLEVPTDTPHFRILWVIQFTKQRDHKGAMAGLNNVRNLMRQAGHKCMHNGSKIEVEVRWVLMTPTQATSVSDREWKMPAGWDSNTLHNDHRGFLWLQEMDISLARA